MDATKKGCLFSPGDDDSFDFFLSLYFQILDMAWKHEIRLLILYEFFYSRLTEKQELEALGWQRQSVDVSHIMISVCFFLSNKPTSMVDVGRSSVTLYVKLIAVLDCASI